MGRIWKRGRGKLGFLQPVLGTWVARSDGPMGPVRCTRRIAPVLGGSYFELRALWEFGLSGNEAPGKVTAPGKRTSKSVKAVPAGVSAGNGVPDLALEFETRGGYKELALIGQDGNGEIAFWSFTSDGKRSQGKVCDVREVHEEAFGFEAQMPAGLARMIYWPDGSEGFHWAAESRSARGWKRFVEHHYRPASNPPKDA